MNILQLAGMLPRDPQFREWLKHRNAYPHEISEDEAARFIRALCRVESRRELLGNFDAAQRFHTHIRKPFLLWKEHQLENV